MSIEFDAKVGAGFHAVPLMLPSETVLRLVATRPHVAAFMP